MHRIKKIVYANKPIKPRSQKGVRKVDRQKRVEAKIITTKYQIILIITNLTSAFRISIINLVTLHKCNRSLRENKMKNMEKKKYT